MIVKTWRTVHKPDDPMDDSSGQVKAFEVVWDQDS